ncbi:DUF6197 family protein [Methylocapsa palsarum]|uniref:Uncharacterized protein n=1 Tax=Methylocapsa palsarum TaxID=1612308 RepID=A0A1I3XL72_9HYPH|nr:hypothetical protein [Methylocapsa palsarum]SFK19791.1 hypothetical protein SAMN05444581_103198 [Methylocapsa palsarum]
MAYGETVIKILQESGRTLKEKGWTRFAMARDANGDTCCLNSEHAVSYCLWASVVKGWRTVDPENEKFYFPFFERKFLDVLQLKFGYSFPVTRWNDEVAGSLEEVTQFLNAVIAVIPPDAMIIVPVRANAKVRRRAMGSSNPKFDERSAEPHREPAFLFSDAWALSEMRQPPTRRPCA